ncbi:hypothetical protein [Psychroflexus planctonicus]|uniref:Uncharacterized protein n=1 Tax=Psychroflexus planctonicus TaxID=1526575 RepID=A0ABQ1SBE0_9FLAO|nr:hypothetical protein [Psychroflexus planctonicus]GGE24139.1 hypothetical protein GCM10010832_01060 [Psychroflexus planctonicus]
MKTKNINIKKEIGIGALVGLIANAIGMLIFSGFFIQEFDFERIFIIAYENQVLNKIIALGAILNFLPFYLFLRKNLIYRARGVLIATIVVAIFTVILYFSK